MAGQPCTASALPAAAHVVGNAFVNQYYNVLHQSPQVVHRFYTDASRLTRAEAGADGAVETVVSQSEIHQKVMALDYGDLKAEIITVDSQDSLTGGVLVMVTGSLTSKSSGKRTFVQSFFLAPQEKGYFVLNDIFRYLEEEPQNNKQAFSSANGTPEPIQVRISEEPELPLPTEHGVPATAPLPPTPAVEPTVEEVFDLPEKVDASDASDDAGTEDLTHVVMTPVIDEPPSPMRAPAGCVPSLEEASDEAPKKSYASIVSYASILRTKESIGSPLPAYNTVQKAASPVTERSPQFSPSPTTTSAACQDSLDGVVNENDVDGRSVYVKNLPMSVSSSQLEEEFRQFGHLKLGGVNVKSQKQGVCYAFVEFEEAGSAQTAIEASPICIGGRQVYIEEKRPMGPRVGGRSSRLSTTGRTDRPFRSDGVRGRGPFSGRVLSGRGIGQDRDISNRGRGTGPVRSGNFGGVSISNVADDSLGANMANAENSRRDGQGGNGNRVLRRGGSNQAARNGGVTTFVDDTV